MIIEGALTMDAQLNDVRATRSPPLDFYMAVDLRWAEMTARAPYMRAAAMLTIGNMAPLGGVISRFGLPSGILLADGRTDTPALYDARRPTHTAVTLRGTGDRVPSLPLPPFLPPALVKR